jgi:hypothetical protein
MIELIVMALATHRALGLWFGQTVLTYPRLWLTKVGMGPLVNCPICMSVWVGSGVVALWWLGGFWGQLWVWGIALSGAAEWLQVLPSLMTHRPANVAAPQQDLGRLEALESKVSSLVDAVKNR